MVDPATLQRCFAVTLLDTYSISLVPELFARIAAEQWGPLLTEVIEICAGTDLVPSAQVDALHTWLDKLTNGTPIVDAVRAAVPLGVLTDLSPVEHESGGHGGHEAYASWSISPEGRFSRGDVDTFTNALGADIIRGKGVFRRESAGHFEVQVVGRRKTVTESADEVPENVFVAIGLEGELTDAISIRSRRA